MSQAVAPTYEEIVLRARELAKQHPDMVQFREIGPSEEGRGIPMLTIGDVERNLPLFTATGGMHGSEARGSSGRFKYVPLSTPRPASLHPHRRV